jgi:hypothetical protein
VRRTDLMAPFDSEPETIFSGEDPYLDNTALTMVMRISVSGMIGISHRDCIPPAQ